MVSSPSATPSRRRLSPIRKRAEVEAAIERVDGWRKTYRRSNKAHSLAKRMDADEGKTMEEMESVLRPVEGLPRHL